MNKLFFDSCCNCFRYIACYALETEKPIGRVDLASFDMRSLADILHPPENDPCLTGDYYLRGDAIKAILPWVLSEMNPSIYAYILESFTLGGSNKEMMDAWSNAAEHLGVECSFEIIADIPFLGEMRLPLVFIKNVGSRAGTCLLTESAPGQLIDFCHAKGMHISIVAEEKLSNYDEAIFKDYLSSLGWFGSESNRPYFM